MITLESNLSGMIQWFVDAAFAIHNDMKIHIGGVLSLKKMIFTVP